jgi:hypothetical protein
VSQSAPSPGGDPQLVRVRRRSRRSSRRRRAARQRLLLRRGLIAAGVVAVIGFPAGVIANDLVVARRALIGAEAELRDGRAALAAGDLVRAAGAVRSADLLVTDLPARLGRPIWRVVAATPVAGRPFALARALVDTAAATTGLARQAADEGFDTFLSGFDPRASEGRVDLAPLVAVGQRLERLETEPLVAALDRLEDAGTGVTNPQLLSARRGLLDLGSELVMRIERVRGLAEVVPGLLGADGARTHLVVLQNSAELRGAGGLYGEATLLRIDGGRMSLDPVAPVTSELLDAVPVSEEFRIRYASLYADRSLGIANVDPDLATTARATLALYRQQTGVSADGLVLLDPFGLQALLEALDVTLDLHAAYYAGVGGSAADAREADARGDDEALSSLPATEPGTGPVTGPGTPPSALPATLAASGFARFVTSDVYDVFGSARGAERDAFSTALGEQALAAVITRTWDGPRVLRAIIDASAGRHLQVHSSVASEQAALRSVAAGGDLAGFLSRDMVDAIAVTHRNAVGGKQDVHVGHRIAASVELGLPDAAALRAAQRADSDRAQVEVERRLVLDVAVTNMLAPGTRDLYVSGSCFREDVFVGCFAGPDAEHRTGLGFMLAAQETVTSVTDDFGFPPVLRGTMHGATALDLVLRVPPQEQRSVRIVTSSPQLLGVGPDGELTYRLALWRQAKGVPDLVDLTVSAPPGYRVAGADLVGGRRPLTLAGPDAEASATRLRVRQRSVSITGATGSDVEVRVRLVPSG